MGKNINLLYKNLSNKYFFRNKNKLLNSQGYTKELLLLLDISKIEPKAVLEIGCMDGYKLNEINKFYNKAKIKYFGIDLSDKAIEYGKSKFKDIKLLKRSSLDINKFNFKFDLIVCDFLYLLDREHIFKQFDLIYNLLSNKGNLIISDFDPSFPHYNYDKRNKKLNSFKVDYKPFLVGSGLFKLNILHKWKEKNNKFLSNDVSISIYEKINFHKEYPSNV